MSGIPVEKRSVLSRMIVDARTAKRWSQEELADQATQKIAELETIVTGAGGIVSPEERMAWQDLEITRHHVQVLENCPYKPLGTHEKRGRLLAVCVVLNMDRAKVNEVAGGI